MNYKSTRQKARVYACIKSIWPNEGEKDEHGFPIFCSISPDTLQQMDLMAAKLWLHNPDLYLYEIKELVLQLLCWYDTQPKRLNHEI